MTQTLPTSASAALAAFSACIGAQNVLSAPEQTAPYFRDYSGRYQGNGLAVLLPASTQEVAELVTLCAAHDLVIVPQGGNTGLVGGSIPYQDKAVIISLKRMNRIRELDAANFTMTVEAGCILQTIQQQATEAGLYFPLALGAQGSCSIGGNIATNAGGILTIRYGNTRDLVLGLEVVLPDGTIWNGLRRLRKDNTGYDLKQLFIGSEGTLGIITAAVLKLVPDPGQRECFFAGLSSMEQVVSFLSFLRRHFGETIQAFELLSRPSLEAILRYMPDARDPLQHPCEWLVLAEVTAPHQAGNDSALLARRVENALAAAMDEGLLQDCVLAQNHTQRRAFWEMRECVSDAIQASIGGSIKHDVAVPVAALPDFVRDTAHLLQQEMPHAVPVIFGHAGDGNLHYDLVARDADAAAGFLSCWEQANRLVHHVAEKYHGSFAAEHGVGHFKTGEFMARKPETDRLLMRRIKQVIDPHNRMNPDVIWTGKDDA